MSGWDGLMIGARWKCGHPKTLENSLYSQHSAGKARCRLCHRQRGLEYWERLRFEASDRDGRVLEADPRADQLGGEFAQARSRYQTKASRFIRRISS